MKRRIQRHHRQREIAERDECRCTSTADRQPSRPHWIDVHATIAVKNPHLDRNVQCIVQPRSETSDSRFDGVDMVWFASKQARRAPGPPPASVDAGEDGKKFLAGGAPRAASLVHQRVIDVGGDSNAIK